MNNAKSALEVIHFFKHEAKLSYNQCCDFSLLRVKPDSNFKVAINKKSFCDISPPLADVADAASDDGTNIAVSKTADHQHTLAANLSSVFSMNLVSHPGMGQSHYVLLNCFRTTIPMTRLNTP